MVNACALSLALVSCAAQTDSATAPSLAQTLGIATTVPEPKDFVAQSRTQGEKDYPNIGLTPQGRAEQAWTAEERAKIEAGLVAKSQKR